MGLFDFFSSDLAIDLGTANTLIIKNEKIVVDEPSIIAIDRATSKVLAIGRQAMQMHEKTHDHIRTIRPLKDGVIADFHAAEEMIRGMIKMIDEILLETPIMTDPMLKGHPTSSKRLSIAGKAFHVSLVSKALRKSEASQDAWNRFQQQWRTTADGK